jgi:hypothetical protein
VTARLDRPPVTGGERLKITIEFVEQMTRRISTSVRPGAGQALQVFVIGAMSLAASWSRK